MTCRRAIGAGRGDAEFDCCECGRHIIVITGDLPDPRLCAACLTIPGWLAIPAFRAIIDPEGEVREPIYTVLPRWGDPS